MIRQTKYFYCFLVIVLCLNPATISRAQNEVSDLPELTLEDIYASATFQGQGFQGGRWSDEGPIIRYIEREQEGEVTHLVEYNLETDTRSRLIEGSALYAADVDRQIAIEDYEYTADGTKVLIYTDSEQVWRYNTKGFYYIYDVEEKSLTPLSDRDKGFQMFAKFSPDGRRAAFVRKRDLFLVNLETMEEIRLTDTGSEGGIINGTADWVYEEEFGLRDGWSWSPDGSRIAFFQLDESETRPYTLTDLRQGLYPELTRFRYPKAGEKNSEIRIGVIDVPSGEPRFFDTNTWNAGGDSLEYIPRMGWTPEIDGRHTVWLFRLNRDQNHLDLIYGEPGTMETRVVLEEHEESWIEVETGFSDRDVGKINYLNDGEHFVWITEKDGYRHIYLHENSGRLVRQITSGSWDVTDFHGIDEDKGLVYLSGTIESPLERHLYRVGLGIEESSDISGEPTKITKARGWHVVNMSSDAGYYIDTYSNATRPPVVTLHTADGREVTVLEANEKLRETVDDYDLPAPEFMTVPAADATPLNGYMVKPNDFDPDREYPLLLYVYGGPGSQTVQRTWGGSRYLWHVYLAREHDILVASVDNRGTGGRGKAFKSTTYRQLGRIEARDQIGAAKHLQELPYVDGNRIGMWGWSYGGYLTLLSMLFDEGPQVLDVGAAVAPVTNWRLYDTIYTERYMSTPDKNKRGYLKGSPIHYADRLQSNQDLLIVHGDMDDNVHFQNSVRMIDALQEANKQFEFMMYPGRDHGIYGGLTRLHLFRLLTDFITENI
jgi:dipeptidyl-peptidase-4